MAGADVDDRFRKSKSSALLPARGGCGCCTFGDAALDARPELVPLPPDADADADAGAAVNEAKRKSSSLDDMGGRACGEVAADDALDAGFAAAAAADGLETDRPPKSRISSCLSGIRTCK